MKAARIALLALVCTVPLAASAQWQWLDQSGRKVFSDKAPPPDIAPNRILKRPAGAPAPAAQSEAPAPTATAAAPTAAALPKPSGKDAALEEKRKQAEAAEAAKRKAEEEKLAVAKADNCNRARASKAAFDSGVRITRVNEKGEREFLDDAQRAAELQRLESMITRECAK